MSDVVRYGDRFIIVISDDGTKRGICLRCNSTISGPLLTVDEAASLMAAHEETRCPL